MTDALTRDRPDGTKLSVEEILANAYAKNDKDVLLIKLIDRLHNMMTIDSMSNEKQRKIALETLEHFLLLSASINVNLEQELNFFIYNIIALPEGVSSVEELYMFSELREKAVLHPLNFENDELKI
jgi:(p)ppGpp synthase/HD superfamily hydrolase